MLTIAEAGERLGLSRWTVSSMLESGQLPGLVLKSGKRKRVWRIREEALQAWITAKEVETRKSIQGERRELAVVR